MDVGLERVMAILNHSDESILPLGQERLEARGGATGKGRDASQGQNTPPAGWSLAGARYVVRLARGPATRCAERLAGDSPKTIRMLQYSHDTL